MHLLNEAKVKNLVYLDESSRQHDMMNKTPSIYCFRDEVHASCFTYIQLATLAML